MAESQKGASSTAGLQKKNSSLDEDFGNDFLTSWKSAKVGKDAIDFDVETVPCAGKKPFNFDKLDDFELGGDFGKISSFKMDMSDLVFSSPLKKAEKPKEKSVKESGKQDSKQDKFSFTFDFNELDRFSLDSDLLKEKKIPSKRTDGGPDCSTKYNRDQDSTSYSAKSIDAFENDKTKKVSNADNVATSSLRTLVEPDVINGSGLSTSNLVNHDVSHEARIPEEKQINIEDENKVDMHDTEKLGEHSAGACSTKSYAEKAVEDTSLSSVSGNGSAHEAPPKFPTGLPFLDPLNVSSAREQDNSMRSINSSQSRNSSPVNSYNSRCGPETRKSESLNIRGKIQKNQCKEAEDIGGSTILSEPTKCQKDGGNSSDTDTLQKNLLELKNSGEKQNPISMLLSSSLHRDSGIVKSLAVNEKVSTALPFKSLDKSGDNASQPTSSLTPKQLNSMHIRKVETMHLYPTNEKREPKQNDEKSENEKVGVLKLFGRSITKSGSIVLGRERNNKGIDASRFQLHSSNVSCTANASGSVKSSSPNLVSSTPPTKSSSVLSVKRQNTSLKDGKRSDISSLAVSRLTKLNISTPKSTLHKETKSARFPDRKLACALSTISKIASPTTEKQALLSPPLKRKILEDSREDPVTQTSLKRATDSSLETRKSSEASPKFDRKVVPSPEACRNDACVQHITSPKGALMLGSMMDFEVPVLVENDGNVEKAEACSKELDNICNMLKKKHEEARELLVRAIVNNNALLMLNHPMFEEKFRGLPPACNLRNFKELF